MAYTNFTNCTEQEYINIIYSQEDKNRIRIWFNNVELQDADEYCESLKGINRILPNDGTKKLMLSNFIAKEYELTLRDLPSEVIIADQVKISIGTLVDEINVIYEDVPIGIFNIQETPETDNNKIVLKLRDNRVKFDFGYNAKPLIDLNNGKATYKQILNDMCTQAGVINDVTTFNGENIEVAIYDNTIKATTYVSYIAEQAGAIPVITREGHLDFVYLNNLKTWKIPLDIIEKYEISTPFTIERVVYESGLIKYETDSDETLETLYLDSSNMYVTSQEQVESVFDIVEDFTIDSVSTGKVLGNAAIDPYDLIEVYGYYEEDENGNYNFVADEETVVFKTLANNTYDYKGVCKNTFETVIGKEERKENVVKGGDEEFKRWARTEINNLNAEVLITAGKVESVEGIVLGTEEYNLTKDTTFQEGKKYYIQVNLHYQEYRQYENYDGDRSGNPQELGLYEAIYSYTYTLTDDTEFDGGDYYTYNGETYDIVNPVSLELYELINEEYVLSEDTVFDKDKTYYYLDYQEQYQQYSKNPSELGFYNRIEDISGYQLTTDTSFVEEKAYFDKNYDIDESIPENTIYEQTTTPSIAEQFEGLDSSINEKLKGVQGSINSVETSVSQLTRDTYTKTQINSIVNGTGVDGVVVSAAISESGTFDKDGLLIQKEDENGNIISDTSGRFNEKGVQVKTKDGNEIFYSGYVDDTRFDIGSRHYQGKTIVYTQNLQSQGETIIGSYCLIQDYEEGSGWFVL